MTKANWVATLLALGAVGCSATPSTGSFSTEDIEASAEKGDCASDDACDDAAAESALEQLGLDRFYREGDSWQVAWVYRNDDSSHRDPNQQVGRATYSAPTLVTYLVEDVDSALFGRVERQLATISVSSDGEPPSAIDALLGDVFPNVDERIDYTINELFNPVAKRFYSLNQFGQTVSVERDLDGRSNLTMQFDSLPNALPNLDRIEPRAACDDAFFANLRNPEARAYTACWAPFEAIGNLAEPPDSLDRIAEAVDFDKTVRGIHFAPTAAQPDYMFWVPGNPHPSFIAGPRGLGFLVSTGAE